MPLSPATFAARRAALAAATAAPVLLLGNGHRARNLPQYGVPFRQDSNFLFFTGCAEPEAAALVQPDGHTTLFLVLPAEDDALWHGHVDSPEDLRERYGVDAVRAHSELEAACEGLRLLTLAVPDEGRNQQATRITGIPLRFGREHGSEALVEYVIRTRRIKGPEELAEHRLAADATEAAFRVAMAATRPGGNEAAVAALFEGALAARGYTTGYHSIVTVRGEVLHNPTWHNPLRSGELLLLDGGGEGPQGHGVDVTRTWPVAGRFTAPQKAVYAAVLEAQRACIARVRSGVRYRDVHMQAAEVLAQFMVDEGLLRGTVQEVLERHAHALFFPHGVGHLLGLDVHDLETFGDRAAYAPGRVRSTHFGTAWLRLDLDLEPGMLVTIEPGFYVVPAILADPTLRERFGALVDWERAQRWVGFGGIRIEDDVVCTAGEPEVLTARIPKTIEEVEAAVGQGPDALARLSA